MSGTKDHTRELRAERNSNRGYRGQWAGKGKGKAKQDCTRSGKRKYSVEVRVRPGGAWLGREGKGEGMCEECVLQGNEIYR